MMWLLPALALLLSFASNLPHIHAGECLCDSVAPGMSGIAVHNRSVHSDGNAIFHPIVIRGTGLPTRRTQSFRPCSVDQSSVEIRIYEGNVANMANDWYFGSILLENINPASNIRVTFEYTFQQLQDCHSSGCDCFDCTISRLLVTAEEVTKPRKQHPDVVLQQNKETIEIDITTGGAFTNLHHTYAYQLWQGKHYNLPYADHENWLQHDFSWYEMYNDSMIHTDLCLPSSDRLLISDG